MAAEHDYPVIVVGDDIPAKSVTLERISNDSVVSLLGSTIIFEILRGSNSKVYKSVDTNDGITIVNAAMGLIEIGNIQTDDLTAANYHYVLRVVYADGFRKTFLGGNLPIIPKNLSKYKEVL